MEGYSIAEHLAESGIYHPSLPVRFASVGEPDAEGYLEAELDDGNLAAVYIASQTETLCPYRLASWQSASQHQGKPLIAIGFAFAPIPPHVNLDAVIRVLAAPELCQAEHLALDAKDNGLFVRLDEPDIACEAVGDGKVIVSVAASVYPIARWMIDDDFRPPAMVIRQYYEPLTKTSWLARWKQKSLKHRRILPEVAKRTESLTSRPFVAGRLVKVKTSDIYGHESERLFANLGCDAAITRLPARTPTEPEPKGETE